MELALGKAIRVSDIGLQIEGHIPLAVWRQIGVDLAKASVGLSWAWGDWLVYGDDHYGEDAASAYDLCVECTGWARQTVMNRASTSRAWPPDERAAGLPHWIGETTAPLVRDPRTREAAGKLVDAAMRGHWTREDLREAVSQVRDVVEPPKLPPILPVIRPAGPRVYELAHEVCHGELEQTVVERRLTQDFWTRLQNRIEEEYGRF